MKKLLAGVFAVFILAGAGQVSFAETDLKSLAEGLKIGGGVTMIMQNVQNANADKADLINDKSPTVSSYSVDLTVEKEFDKNNKAFLHIETGNGSIEDQLEVFSNVNRDADDSDDGLSVTEAYFEHAFNSSGFKLTAGKIDPTTAVDENAYANDETAQFLGHAFRNAANINFSDNAFGFKVGYESDFADVAVQYIDASDNGDFTRNAFTSAQINFKPGFIDGKDGNYRVYGWANTSDYTKDDGSADDEKNYGLGISLDQQLSDITGVFVRYSWSRGDVVSFDNDGNPENYLSQSWSAGIQFNTSWIGKNDILALAVGQVYISDEIKNAAGLKGCAENHAEIYYSWNVTDYLSISPDIQMIHSPCGDEDADTIFASAIRAQINF